MKLRGQFLLVLLVAVLLLPVAVSGRRLAAARAQLDAQVASAVGVAGDVERVLELRERQELVAEKKRPEQDVIARVNAALMDADVSPTQFSGVRPASDVALPGAGNGALQYRRQTVHVSLRRLAVQELGAFLASWSAPQDLWTPQRIDLTHVASESDPARYDVTLTISATYLADR